MFKIVVKDHYIPIRIDRFLKLLYPSLTQGVIERGIRKNHIKINNHNGSISANIRVKNNDEIDLMNYFKDYENLTKDTRKLIYYNESIKSLAHKITTHYKISETEHYIVINKPQFISTQGGSNILLSIDHALKYLNSLGNNFRLVHRLDKETSGIMIIAKNREAAIKLTNAFSDRLINKEYIAILQGVPTHNSGIISSDIIKFVKNSSLEKKEKIKNSVTKYQIEAISHDQKLSLISFTPITGRTHQLRIHAKELNCHILGDDKYGYNNGDNNCNANNLTLKLHAYKITIPKDIFETNQIYIATLPNKFKQLILKFFYKSESKKIVSLLA